MVSLPAPPERARPRGCWSGHRAGWCGARASACRWWQVLFSLDFVLASLVLPGLGVQMCPWFCQLTSFLWELALHSIFPGANSKCPEVALLDAAWSDPVLAYVLDVAHLCPGEIHVCCWFCCWWRHSFSADAALVCWSHRPMLSQLGCGQCFFKEILRESPAFPLLLNS